MPCPALRFGDRRVQALLASLCCFKHLLGGISSRSLSPLVAGLLPGYTPRQMSYDLNRLRQNGFLVRIDGSQRYKLTPRERSSFPRIHPGVAARRVSRDGCRKAGR
jgi:hypothetical protein